MFASVSYNLRASHSPIVLKIQTRNFSLAATGIITETRAPFHRQGRNSLPCSLISTFWITENIGVFKLTVGSYFVKFKQCLVKQSETAVYSS